MKSIEQCEEALEQTLIRLGSVTGPETKIFPALDLIAPKGYRPVVSLFENDRKKRRTASAETWSPSTGEIRIYFEPAGMADEPQPSATANSAPVVDTVIPELVKALRDAETSPGRMFVALKWFRDDYLPSTGLSWTQDLQRRQAALAEAIENGWILTSKVPNPKAPQYPTTTIRTNRQMATGGSAPPSRFNPVTIPGEPLSATLLRDRGPR